MSAAISVVVPTCDRPAGLNELLAALRRQEPVDGSFEVIVVDDGSRTPVADQLGGTAEGLDLDVIRTENRGPAAARNTGVAAARGEFLAFIDDDCLPATDWLSTLDRARREYPEATLGGRTVCGLSGNRWAESSQALEDAVYRRANRDPSRSRFLSSKNLAMPRALFRRCGGFDPAFRFSEDRDLCARLVGAGERLVYLPDAVVEHMNPSDRRRFWRQHFGYGQGARRFHRRHSGGSPRVEVGDYAAFASEALFGPKRPGVARTTVLSLIFLSQLASLLGYLRAGEEGLESTRPEGRVEAMGGVGR